MARNTDGFNRNKVEQKLLWDVVSQTFKNKKFSSVTGIDLPILTFRE